MPLSTALKKINARAKQLKKKHPNAKYKTLQKQAGKEFKAGKLKAKRKPAKRKSVNRKRTVGAIRKRKTSVPRKRTKRLGAKARARVITRVITKVRYRTRAKKQTKRRRIGAAGSKSMVPLLIGGAVVLGLGYMLLKKSTGTPTLIQTGNQQRNSSANNVLAYATAVGLGISAIAKLIDALNNSGDTAVITAGQNPQGYIDQGTSAGWLSGD